MHDPLNDTNDDLVYYVSGSVYSQHLCFHLLLFPFNSDIEINETHFVANANTVADTNADAQYELSLSPFTFYKREVAIPDFTI